MSEAKYVPNPIMDTKSTDLQQLVQRYNSIEKIPENKNLEWEDDYTVEKNCGWAKIESVEQLREHILKEEEKLQSYGWRKRITPEEVHEVYKESNLTSDEFLSELKGLCVGYTDEPTCRYNGETATLSRLVSTTRYFDTSDQILEVFRGVSKTRDIIFVGIYLEKKSSCGTYGPDLPLKLDYHFGLRAITIKR